MVCHLMRVVGGADEEVDESILNVQFANKFAPCWKQGMPLQASILMSSTLKFAIVHPNDRKILHLVENEII